MGQAKAIRVAPIRSADARAFVKRVHYSGKVVNNSKLHFGVFMAGRLEGVMQFGSSLDKRKLQGLVAQTGWNGFIELNRMAFSDRLPRNSESRALAIAFRIMRRQYPHLEWIVSFADATQCGDGTIYRASGFVLTGIRKNTTIWKNPLGEIKSDLGCKTTISRVTHTKGSHIGSNGKASMLGLKEDGWYPLPGYQLRYIYFLNPAARERLAVPIIPVSRIAEIGASMYRGEARPKQATADTIGTAAGQHRPGRSKPLKEAVRA